MRQLGFVTLIAGVIGISTQGHGAESAPLTVSLDYRVDDSVLGCPTLREFQRRIAKQVRYDPFRADAELKLSTKIYRSPTGLEAELVWKRRDGSLEGERRLSSGDDCIKLAKGMSFAVAVQIQLLSGGSDPEPPRESQPSPTRATQGDVSAESETQRSPTPEPREHSMRPTLALGVGPHVALGTAPSLSTGGRVFARLGFERVDFELAGEAELPVSHETAMGAGFSMNSFDASFAPCLRGGPLRACGIAVVGRSEVEGFGVEAVRRAASTVFRAGLRFGVDQRLTPLLSFGAHVDGLVLLTPVTVYLRTTPVWTMPTLAAKAGIDLAILFQ
jgi:hypothetical protein